MTTEEKIKRVKLLSDIDVSDDINDAIIEALLETARDEILEWSFRYHTANGEPLTDVPEMYHSKQCMAVVNGFSQTGETGAVSINMNGVSRSFKYSDMTDWIRNNFPVSVMVG